MATAPTYADETWASDYLLAAGRVIPDWDSATTAEREAALVAGTTYLSGRYGPRWKGWRTDGPNQPLDWPRQGVVSSDGGWPYSATTIPNNVKAANVEAALLSLSGVVLIPATGATNVSIKSERSKLGDLEEEISYGGSGKPTSGSLASTTYPAIDALLWDVLRSPGTQASLIFPDGTTLSPYGVARVDPSGYPFVIP